jgi:hypothetical protein
MGAGGRGPARDSSDLLIGGEMLTRGRKTGQRQNKTFGTKERCCVEGADQAGQRHVTRNRGPERIRVVARRTGEWRDEAAFGRRAGRDMCHGAMMGARPVRLNPLAQDPTW